MAGRRRVCKRAPADVACCVPHVVDFFIVVPAGSVRATPHPRRRYETRLILFVQGKAKDSRRQKEARDRRD